LKGSRIVSGQAFEIYSNNRCTRQ